MFTSWDFFIGGSMKFSHPSVIPSVGLGGLQNPIVHDATGHLLEMFHGISTGKLLVSSGRNAGFTKKNAGFIREK